MPTATPTRKGLRRPEPLVHPVPEALEWLCPGAVVEASHGLAEAEERRSAAREAARTARAEAEAAAGADAAAAEQAAEAGRTPPKSKAPAAREVAEERERDLEAHTNVTVEAKRKLLAALLDNHIEVIVATEDELEEQSREAAKHIGALEELLIRRRAVIALAREVRPEGLSGREAVFTPAPQKRAIDPLAGFGRDAIEGLRGTFSPREWKREDEWDDDERAAAAKALAQGRQRPRFRRPEYVAWMEGE